MRILSQKKWAMRLDLGRLNKIQIEPTKNWIWIIQWWLNQENRGVIGQVVVHVDYPTVDDTKWLAVAAIQNGDELWFLIAMLVYQ